MTSIINPQPNETVDYNNSPNCWQCRHFAISWEPATPYMCSLMGFKSRLMPSIEVLRADGRICRGFMAKATQAQNPNSNTNGTRPSANLISGNSNRSTTQGVTQSSRSSWSA